MKNFIKLIILASFGFLAACNPVDNGWDSGVSNGKHDCSMLAYLQKDSYNWDSTVLMIKQAGLENLFDGKDSKYKDITFFGPTNHSIRRFMLTYKIKQIKDMSPEFCRRMIMMHIINKRVMKSDISFRDMENIEIVGFTPLTTEGDIKLKAYKERESWGEIENAGAEILYLLSENAGDREIPLASPDIETLTGVVHSLNYNYTIGDMMDEDDLYQLIDELL